MRMKRLRQAVGLAILLFSLGLLVWAVWPSSVVERIVQLPGRQIQNSSDELLSPSAIYKLHTKWPGRMQAGSVAEIEVRLSAVDTPISLPASIDSNPGKPIIEARLDLPGVEAAPDGIISQVLPMTTPVDFHWQVRPPVSGRYQGDIWLHEVGLAENGQGIPGRRLVALQSIEIRAVEFLGLNAYFAQILAIFGIILGIGLSVDLFYEWYMMYIKKRSKQI